MPFRARLTILFIALFSAFVPLGAQEQEPADSLVRLMNAQSAHMVNTDQKKFREVIGPATFLHNGTYLICDTAYWDVDQKVINAYGNVQILQDETVLSSDKLNYIIDDNTAQFRGSLVQLRDKEGNLLRTRNLDYNTKDSVAVFTQGASMRDKDGQIIESYDGTYDSKTKLFNFSTNVNMYTDSVFVKTNRLTYHGDNSEAYFEGGVDAWQDDNMLSSDYAVYDKANEVFHFHDNVHALADSRECWADSALFYKLVNDAELFGHTQILDTAQNLNALAEYVKYVDTLSRVTLQGEAAIVAVTDQDGQIDTLYLGADLLSYTTTPMCAVDPIEVSAAGQRLQNLQGDPVDAYRKKAADNAAEEQAKEKREKAEARGLKNNGQDQKLGGARGSGESIGDKLAQVPESVPDIPASDEPAAAEGKPTPDESAAPEDQPAPDDTAAQDSVDVEPAPEPVDSTAVGMVKAVGNVRLFRTDIQARCDSLVYTDLDSLGRMYIDPVIWNEEGRHQYSSDSLFIVVANGKMEKANLLANAFIAIQEDSLCYDQIRGAEMMAYFDTTAALSRFDALGGADAMFYLRENETLATVNKVESKMLSARFEEGELSQIFYFDSPKNDAYPVVQLPKEDRLKRGFNWRADERPKSKEDVTLLTLRRSERRLYEMRPRAAFRETDRYFPGYISDVYKRIAIRDSLKKLPKVSDMQVDSLAAQTDSLAVEADSLALAADSLAVQNDSPAAATDSLETGAKVDTLDFSSPEAAIKSIEKATSENEPDPKALKKEQKQKEREARIAELDARDAAKAEAKHQKELEKQRAKTLKQLLKAEKQEAKEQKILDRYVKRFEKKKARKAKDLPEEQEGLEEVKPEELEASEDPEKPKLFAKLKRKG